MRAAGDALTYIVSYYGPPAHTQGGPRFTSAVELLTDRCRAFGDVLEAGIPNGIRPEELDRSKDPADATRDDVVAALEAWGGSADERVGPDTMLLVWTRDWLRWVNDLEHELPQPVAEVAATASVPWWRR
jgi:hypothetical protein